MEYYEINAFADRSTGYEFRGAHAWFTADRCLLMENGGHILILERKTGERLRKKKLPRSLIQVLYNRCFLLRISEDGQKIPFAGKAACEEVYPEFFMIDMTERCNLGCVYCLRDIRSEGKSISDEVLKDICSYITRYCDERKLSDVTIQPWGGEPLLNIRQILRLRNWITPRHTRVHIDIESNGTLLSEDAARSLRKLEVGVGISLDGYPEIHDLQRPYPDGRGSSEGTLNALSRVQRSYGGRAGIITTITRINKDSLADILEYDAGVLGLSSVKMNYVHESMYAESAGLCLTEEEIAQAEETIFRTLLSLNERDLHIEEQNIRTKILNLLRLADTDICLSRGCQGGRKMIVFDMEGNFYPCELTDEPAWKLGSIYEDQDLMTAIRKKMKTHLYFAQKWEARCDGCPWYVFCRGGCTVRVISRGQRPPKIDETECAVNRALYPLIIEFLLTSPEKLEPLYRETIR